MTNKQHPITPPPELVQQWMNAPDWLGLGCHPVRSVPVETYAKRLVEAAQWGADQEVEACCEWLEENYENYLAADLRAARRSKPPSLVKEALEAWEKQMASYEETDADMDTIRRALERLQELEGNG